MKVEKVLPRQRWSGCEADWVVRPTGASITPGHPARSRWSRPSLFWQGGDLRPANLYFAVRWTFFRASYRSRTLFATVFISTLFSFASTPQVFPARASVINALKSDLPAVAILWAMNSSPQVALY